MLYFGSFNPIHNGHLMIADYVLNLSLCDELWFVVSPQNPLKKSSELIDETQRFIMSTLAVKEWNRAIKVSDVEFTMSKPSYTIRTIKKLESLHPDKKFSLLMGEDNLMFFDCWKQWQDIVERCEIVVYPRGDYSSVVIQDKIRELRLESEIKASRFHYLSDAPHIDISSTMIRAAIDMADGMTAQSVVNYIKENGLYDRK